MSVLAASAAASPLPAHAAPAAAAARATVPASPYVHHQSPAALAAAAAHAALAVSPHRHTPLLGHGSAAQTQERLQRKQRQLADASAAATTSTSSRSSSHAAGGSSSSSSSSGAAPSLLPLPASEMSCHALLSLHLDDYVHLVDGLLISLDPALATQQQSAAAAASSAAAVGLSSDVWMRKLLRKDALLQEAVSALLEHQRLQRRMQEQYAELAILDAGIIGFCSELGALEQRLIHASTDPRTLQPASLAATSAPATSLPFTLRSVLRVSESYSRMSYAPADFLDPHLNAERIHKLPVQAPAPQEAAAARSLLHLTPEEMLQMAKEERAKEEEEARRVKEERERQEAGMSDVAQAPPSSAAGQQQSFAELLASAGGAAQLGTPHMMRQESAHRVPVTAPIALDLDLDLESSDEEED